MTSRKLLAAAFLAASACAGMARNSNTATSPEPMATPGLFDDDDDDETTSAIPPTETSPFAETSSTVTPDPQPQPQPDPPTPTPTSAASNEPTLNTLSPN